MASTMALEKPARSPSFPVPKVKRGIVRVAPCVTIGECGE